MPSLLHTLFPEYQLSALHAEPPSAKCAYHVVPEEKDERYKCQEHIKPKPRIIDKLIQVKQAVYQSDPFCLKRYDVEKQQLEIRIEH